MGKRAIISLDIAVGKCNGCGRCAAVCRNDVFSMKEIGGKVRAVSVWSAKCSGCGRCTAICPQKAIELDILAGVPELAYEM